MIRFCRVSPKMSVTLDDNNNGDYQLKSRAAGGQQKALWEPYAADDGEDVELFSATWCDS